MKILFIIVYIELLPLFLSSEATSNGLFSQQCNPFDPPVRRNTNIDHLNGRWFHRQIIPPKTLAPTQLRTHYNYDIISDGIAIINGRFEQTGACIYETVQLKELPYQRAPTYTAFWKWFGRWIDIRILDTDCKTFAIFWACSQRTQGRCTDFFTLISSKDPNGLSQGQLLSLDPILKATICFSIADFIHWPLRQETVCPRKNIFNVDVRNTRK